MASKVTASVTNARPRLSVTLVDAIVESDRVIPLAEVSRVAPNITTSYVSPLAVASYTIPAADIAYINLFLDAEIDVSGLFRYIAESVTLNDGSVIAFAKSQSDSFFIDDFIFSDVGKSLADTITLSDILVPTLVFLRDFADTQSISDSTVLAFAKQAASSVLMSEVLARSFDKNSSDAVLIAELASRSVAKYLTDSVSSGDATYLNSQKLFNETQSIADAAVRDIAKLIADSVVPADAIAFDISKTLADGFAINDSAEAADGLTFTFSISVQNIIFTSDAEQKSFDKTRTDSVGIADSGLLSNQDYIDPTYFAEDYVGASYIF
jgi:hypothetical protein